MLRANTATIFAKMVQLVGFGYSSVCSFIKNPVHHPQCAVRHQSPRVSVRLQDRVIPASCARIFSRLNSLVPLRYLEAMLDAVSILASGHGLQVLRVHAGPISANVIDLIAGWNRSISLLVKPHVAEVSAFLSSDPAVSVWSKRCAQLPAAGFLYIVIHSQAVAGVIVQPRKSFDVPVSRESGYRGIKSASAEAFRARVGVGQISRDGAVIDPLLVIPDESRVAAGDNLQNQVGSVTYRRGLAASAPTFSAWVRAARVIRLDSLVDSSRSAGPVSAEVSQKFSFDLIRSVRKFRAGHRFAALAHAKSARVGRRETRLRLGRAHACFVVAVNESPLLWSDSWFAVLTHQWRQHCSASAFAISNLGVHVARLSGESEWFYRPLSTAGVPMTPVFQEIFENGRGDCLRASIASVLDIPLEEVPNFIEDKTKHQLDGAREWLAGRGRKLFYIRFADPEHLASAFVGFAPDPVVLVGESHSVAENGDRLRHAVVGVANGYGFRTIHDPSPGGRGLYGDPDQVVYIV